jgi:uncharacterized membrane protein (DUF2068 family)
MKPWMLHPIKLEVHEMSRAPVFPTYKGRTLGIVILTAAQFLIGSIHVFFGVWLISATSTISAQSPLIYSSYTLAFGVLTLICAYGIWRGKSWSWHGTVTVSLFVIAADALTLLDLPSIPGIPKMAAIAEITYSLAVLLYLLQKHVRTKYKWRK